MEITDSSNREAGKLIIKVICKCNTSYTKTYTPMRNQCNIYKFSKSLVNYIPDTIIEIINFVSQIY